MAAGSDDVPEPDGSNAFECSRCGEIVPNEDAVALVRSKQMWKTLCPDCFGAVGRPKGYDLIRDLSHLKA